jgi:dimethylaniline monooxygenase (N-oxide forming)
MSTIEQPAPMSTIEQPAPVCIIGAGPCGIAAAAVISGRNRRFDWFEQHDAPGGNWLFGSSTSAAYRHLHTNTSKTRMAYPDRAMPAEIPDYPHHSDVLGYLNAYVDHHDLRRRLTLSTRVDAVRRVPDGWQVTTCSGEQRHYSAVLVANGHLWQPSWPDLPAGDFAGTVMHAHDYVDSEPMRGLRVVVVGLGNTAADVAVEASVVAERTFLSTRSGSWVVPKYLFGRPVDTLGTSARIPLRLRNLSSEAAIRMLVGSPKRYGLPAPAGRYGDSHPVVSTRLLDALAHRAVQPKPPIAAFEAGGVRFADGSRERVDVIINCTGYRVSFPFLDDGVLRVDDNRVELFHQVVAPSQPGLFFLGLVQPIGSVLPIAHGQATWIADLLDGIAKLPSTHEMQSHIRRFRHRLDVRFPGSPRHAMEVDLPEDYLRALGRERRAGIRRANAKRSTACA